MNTTKRILLVLTIVALLVLTLGVSVFAAGTAGDGKAELVATGLGIGNGVEVGTQTIDGVTFAFAAGTHTNGLAPKYYTSGTAVRCYAGNTITITAPSGYIISTVDFTAASTNYAIKSNAFGITVDGAEGTATVTNNSIAVNGNSVVLSNTSSAQWRLKTITVNYAKAASAGASDADKVADEKGMIADSMEITESGAVALKVEGTTYSEVAIAWASDSALAVVDNEAGTVTYTLPEAGADDVVVTLTATLTCGEVTDTKEINVTLVAPMTEAEIVDAAFALSSGATLPGTFTLTGTVSEIVTAYSSSYGNITVNMTVQNTAGEDKTIQCYRLKSGAADASTIVVGNLITVTGTLKNYNGTIEFDANCTLDAITIPELTDVEKVELEKGILDTISAVVADGTATVDVAGTTYSEVAIAWASDNAAITVDGNTLTIVRGAEAQTVTLTATLTCGEATDTKEFTVYVAKAGELTSAEIVDAAYELEAGDILAGTQTVTGTITEIDAAYSSSYGNISVVISVEGTENTLLCYRMNGVGADIIKVGDTITVSGSIKNYDGTIEFNSGCALKAYPAPVAINGVALNIDANVDMMYYVTALEGYTSATASVVFNGATTTVTGTTAGDGRLVFVFEGINPAQLGDAVAITVSVKYTTNTYTATSTTMSVRGYYEQATEYCADNTKLLTLLSDLLVYGAAAQTYVGDTDALVTEGLELTPSTPAATPESILAKTGSAFYSANLILGSDITVGFELDANEGDVVTITLNKKTVQVTIDSTMETPDGTYYVTFADVYATEYDGVITATCGDSSITYSVNSYINENANSADANLAALVAALNTYGVSATAYN